jgi:CRP-like cAMP-binding protein
MGPSARVRLLEADPDLGDLLTSEEFAEARQLAVPVVTVDRYERNPMHLNEHNAFGALVLDGMVLRQLRIADQTGLRLLGPGDIVPLEDSAPPMVVVDSSFEALPDTRLALLGREALFAVQKWPALAAALQMRSAQQADRLVAQLVICQLPRVDQRVLSLLWLLAESWGRVTSAGTTLPLKLTHEALGALVGARRPTVTLALRELTIRGAVVRQSEGWLLLQPPAQPSARAQELRGGAVIENAPSDWRDHRGADAEKTEAAAVAAAQAANEAAYQVLVEAMERLREQHAKTRRRFDERMVEFTMTRERCRESRVRIARERLSRRPQRSPSL